MRRLVVVYNQMAHIHYFITLVQQCYAAEMQMGGSGTTDSRTASVDDESATSAAVRDVLRYWAGDQARWARLLANLTADDPSTDVFLRTSPPAADTFCAKSAGASRTPIDASALAHGVMTGRGEYSHQYVYWMNDMMRSAFRAQGHGVIDVETMLGVRVDAYPCSKDGAGDKLHFCQPGPVDWALDVMVRQISRGATSISAQHAARGAGRT